MKTLIYIIKEHITWRSQIIKLAKADIIKTYSGAAFSWAWAFVKPLIMTMVLWFAFSIGLRLGHPVEGYPFILWLIAGLFPWFYMSDMISGGAGCIRKYSYLVTKMKFPVSTIPTFVGLSNIALHIVLILILIIIYTLSGYIPDIYLLQVPIYMFLMLMFFIVWGLFSSMLSAISKDFLNLVKAFNTAIFWLSGIMWDINEIPVPWLQKALMFNPVTFLATGYRNCFVYKVWIWEQPFAFGCFAIVFFVLILCAIWAYKKLIKDIPDVL